MQSSREWIGEGSDLALNFADLEFDEAVKDLVVLVQSLELNVAA
jgi:hypothetical protein